MQIQVCLNSFLVYFMWSLNLKNQSVTASRGLTAIEKHYSLLYFQSNKATTGHKVSTGPQPESFSALRLLQLRHMVWPQTELILITTQHWFQALHEKVHGMCMCGYCTLCDWPLWAESYVSLLMWVEKIFGKLIFTQGNGDHPSRKNPINSSSIEFESNMAWSTYKEELISCFNVPFAQEK